MSTPFNPYEEVLEEVCDKFAWTARSKYRLLLDFLDTEGVDLDVFRQYMEQRAEAEGCGPGEDDWDDPDDYSDEVL